MKNLKYILLVAVLFLWTGCKTSDENLFTVTKVSDGDTFWIDENEKVRLIGIDAPESRNTGRKKVGYFGKESKAFLKSYLLGKRVKLKYDVDRKDRYNRTLAYVYLEDGTFLNAELVKQGYAVTYTVPPNVMHADLFLRMEQDARENKRGLWAEDNSSSNAR